MSTFSWIGNNGTNDPNDATQAANWLLVSGTGATPTDGDTVNIGTGATLDATNAGSISSFTIVAAGTDTFNFTDQNFTKQSSLTLGDQTTLNLVGHLENNGTIGTNGTAIAGFDINPNGGGGGGNNSQIHLSDMGSSVTINASGALSSDAFIYIDAKAAKLAINVNQTVINSSTLRGDFYLRGPILDTGGTLTISSDNTSLTGLAGNRFSNAGYILIGSQNAISSAKLNARMDGTSGVIELAAGLAGGASLEINTNMPGSQIVEFGGPQTSVTIDATNTLASYGNVGTVATTVLQNQFERFNLFGPGDTIDIANVAITSYSFGKDPTWGNNVLTLFKGGTTVGRLRFTSASAFADGTSSNFVLSSDGASGTNITVSATPVSVVNSGTTYSVGGTLAVFNGPTASATLDWGTAANWTGGTGIGSLPGQYQATHITNSLDQLSAFASYVLNVSSAATSGGLSVDDHFLTLNIAAPLTLAATPGQGSGGGLAQTAGTIDITAGGTLAATNALLAGGGNFTIDSKGLLAVTGNPAFTSGSGLLGIDDEADMQINGGTITSGGAFVIGQNAGASVSVQNAGTVGASVTASYTTVGQSSVTDLSQSTGQSMATLSISGANTTWKDAGGDATTNLSGGMLVGGGGTGVNALGTVVAQSGGNGQLTIDGGASVTEAGFAILGVVSGSSGQAYAQNNAHWTIGDGSMTLPGSIVVGSSTLYGVTPAELTVGLIGQGLLNITSGATVSVAAEAPGANQFSVSVGHGSSSGSNTSVATGVLTVDSALLDSHFGAVAVGNRGQGTLNVNNGGTVLAASGGGVTAAAIIGNNNYTLGTSTVGSNGQLNIGGTIGTALFSAAGSIIDGKDGVGTITVNGGGSLSSSGVLFIGGSSAGRGAATDTGSKFVLQGGTATVQNVTLFTGSTLDLEQGAIGLNAGTNMANGILSVGATATITAQGNGNTTRAVLIDNANFGNGAINNLGLIQALGGTLELMTNIAGSGVERATSGGTLRFDRSVSNTSTVALGGTASFGTVELATMDTFQATLTNFWSGAGGSNQVNVDNVGSILVDSSWNQIDATYGVLNFTASKGIINSLGSLTIAGYHALGFSVAGASTINGLAITALDSAPCYAEGTRILTAHGEVPVETLAEGDLLPTLLHGGGLAPVKWIGVSTVRLDGHPDPDRAAPIRIRAGALSQGVPHRDLRLSPEHAMLIDGVLVPASLLVNGASIIREPAIGTVRYFHIELERHDAILAEGAAGETYLDTGNRDQFDNGGTVRQLHPAFDAADRALAVWASESAAPILLEGEALAALHARLATRAALLGYARTADPALSLHAGGQTLHLTRLAEDLWQASLPAGAATLRLCSRSFVPSADDRRAEDHRSLGVAVADLLLDGVALPDNCFAQGFHAAECDASGSWRWTDGAGLVRLAPAAQPRRVTLRLRSGWVKYWAAA